MCEATVTDEDNEDSESELMDDPESSLQEEGKEVSLIFVLISVILWYLQFNPLTLKTPYLYLVFQVLPTGSRDLKLKIEWRSRECTKNSLRG